MQCLSACLNCMVIACFYVFTLEENVTKLAEDIEVVDKEFQVQENFEQGKLPSILQLCSYFQIHLYTMFLEKQLKTFSPMCEKILCHPIFSS